MGKALATAGGIHDGKAPRSASERRPIHTLAAPRARNPIVSSAYATRRGARDRLRGRRPGVAVGGGEGVANGASVGGASGDAGGGARIDARSASSRLSVAVLGGAGSAPSLVAAPSARSAS